MNSGIIRSSLAALLALGTSLPALADGASQAVSSDVSDTDTVNFEFGSSPITVKPWLLQGHTGYGTQSTAQGQGRVMTIQIDAGKRFPISFSGERVYSQNNNAEGWDVELAPGISARLDASQLDSDTKFHISRQDFTVSGFNLLRGWACSNGYGEDRNCNSEEVTNSVDLTLVNVAGKWFINSYLHTKQQGVQLTILQGSAHVGFKAGVPMDFCVQVAGGAVFGNFAIADEQSWGNLFAEASACLGFQVKTLAEVRDRFGLRYDASPIKDGALRHFSWSNTLSIDHVGFKNDPFGLYWTHARENAGAPNQPAQGSITDNFFGIQAQF